MEGQHVTGSEPALTHVADTNLHVIQRNQHAFDYSGMLEEIHILCPNAVDVFSQQRWHIRRLSEQLLFARQSISLGHSMQEIHMIACRKARNGCEERIGGVPF